MIDCNESAMRRMPPTLRNCGGPRFASAAAAGRLPFPPRARVGPQNLIYLFYSCTNLASMSGLGNLSCVRSTRYTISSCAFTSIDFGEFDPSTLTDLFYCFSGRSSLVTIYADSTWSLPSGGLSDSQRFYSCSNLVGGNGTAWSSSNMGYTYMRIDTDSTPGYLVLDGSVACIKVRRAGLPGSPVPRHAGSCRPGSSAATPA